MRKNYNKLVRDRIPEFLRAKGFSVSARTLTEEQVLTALLEKLQEEATEASTAKHGKLAEELGDLLELMEAIAERAGIPWEKILGEKAQKHTERGGFQQGVFLEHTEGVEDDYHRE